MKKKITESEALMRLSTLCAAAEYCRHDMRRKMLRWDLTDEAKQRIIDRLVAERFIDENRYAHAFVRDKFRYNHWGRVRISYELKMRGISETDISDGLIEITDDETTDVLRRLLENKRRTVKGKSEYEIRGKLIRYAMSKGFDMDSILAVLDD